MITKLQNIVLHLNTYLYQILFQMNSSKVYIPFLEALENKNSITIPTVVKVFAKNTR